jgi:hypothetical protein
MALTVQVMCVQPFIPGMPTTPSALCNNTMLEAPPSSEPCVLRLCTGVGWVPFEWSACSAPSACSEAGTTTRSIACRNANGSLANVSLCPALRPPTLNQCGITVPDSCFEWKVSDWGSCSVTCGRGVRSRRLRCRRPRHAMCFVSVVCCL